MRHAVRAPRRLCPIRPCQLISIVVRFFIGPHTGLNPISPDRYIVDEAMPERSRNGKENGCGHIALAP